MLNRVLFVNNLLVDTHMGYMCILNDVLDANCHSKYTFHRYVSLDLNPIKDYVFLIRNARYFFHFDCVILYQRILCEI